MTKKKQTVHTDWIAYFSDGAGGKFSHLVVQLFAHRLLRIFHMDVFTEF